MRKKDDRPLHQKSWFLIASKVVVLPLVIWLSSKALKCLLDYIYLMLYILYHKCKPLIMTAADDSIFLFSQKIFKTITWKKNIRRYFFPGITMMKLQITLKDIYGWKDFLIILHRKWFCKIFYKIPVPIYLFKYFVLHNFGKLFYKIPFWHLSK